MEYPVHEDIDFQKYWLILKRHRWMGFGVWGLAIALSIVFVHFKKPVYEANGKLLFKKQNATSALVDGAGEKIGELNSLSDKSTPVETEAEVIRSLPIAKATIATLKLKNQKGEPVKPEAFLNQLKVASIRGTDILLISYQSKNPKEAAAIVNQVMRLYTQQNISANRAEAAAARQFILKQLPQTEATVRQLESIFRDFKEQNNVVNLEQEAKSAVEANADLSKQLIQSEARLRDVTAQSGELQQQIGMSLNNAIAASSLSQSTAVQQIVGELQQVEEQLTVQQTRYQEQHPIIANLRRKQAALMTLLQERVTQVVGTAQQIPMANLQASQLQQKLTQDLIALEVERLGLVSQVSALSRAQLAYQARTNNLPKLEQQQRDIERQLEAAQSTYEILLKNLQQVQIAENQNVGNARIASPALVPENPISPKTKLIVVAGFVVGGLLYVVAAFLLELSDPSIKTIKEVRHLLRYTPLGMIPKFKKTARIKTDRTIPELTVQMFPQSIESEAYRMLQANLRFLSPDKELRVVAITSSVSQEGKSTIAANLALTMAQLGHRVLLIDTDMHRPVQHHIWNLTNRVGLSDVIANQIEMDAAIQPITDHLDVLPCGVVPPNPLALIDSKRMHTLIDDVSKHYDFVLFDTPPLSLFADALTLGKKVDGVLLVVRLGVIDTASATAVKDLVSQSNQNILGLVINGVSPENESSTYLKHAQAYYRSDLKFPRITASSSGEQQSIP